MGSEEVGLRAFSPFAPGGLAARSSPLHFTMKIGYPAGTIDFAAAGASEGIAWNPARAIPFCAMSFFMKCSHTNPVRAFSAISIMIP